MQRVQEVKAKRGNIDALTKGIIERKKKGLIIAGEIVKNQAKALCKVGKYPAGSGKVGGAARDSIYAKLIEYAMRIGSALEYFPTIEFGAHITPYRAKALTIPIAPEAIGQRAADFPGLFIYQKDGKAFLAREEDGQLKVYFILLKNVDIPKNPCLRPALAIKKKDVIKVLQAA